MKLQLQLRIRPCNRRAVAFACQVPLSKKCRVRATTMAEAQQSQAHSSTAAASADALLTEHFRYTPLVRISALSLRHSPFAIEENSHRQANLFCKPHIVSHRRHHQHRQHNRLSRALGHRGGPAGHGARKVGLLCRFFVVKERPGGGCAGGDRGRRAPAGNVAGGHG